MENLPPRDWERMLQTQTNILEEIRFQRTKKKSILDRLEALMPSISVLLVAIVGGVFTFLYNSAQINQQALLDKHQKRISEMEVVGKFLPYLSSDDSDPDSEQKREAAIMIVSELATPGLGLKLSSLFDSPGTRKAADSINLAARSEPKSGSFGIEQTKSNVPEASASSRRTGWVYLGHYGTTESKWLTRYLDIKLGDTPTDLINKELGISDKIENLYVRLGMPTPSGEFPKVIDNIGRSDSVQIKRVAEWYTTGYWWAQVVYSR